MKKRRGKAKWYVLWLVMMAVFSGCIFMLSRYSVVIPDVLMGKEYKETELFEKAMEYETQQLEEYFTLQGMVADDWQIDGDKTILSLCDIYTNGYLWSLGELCNVSIPGEEYTGQLKKTEKEFWKSGCSLDSLFSLQRHLTYDGVLYYDYGRLYEVADSAADRGYIKLVHDLLQKNTLSAIKFKNIGQGCYRMDALPFEENGEEIRKDVYDMRTAQTMAKYVAQMYSYYREKYAMGRSNFSYNFSQGNLNMPENIAVDYSMDESGSADVMYSAVSYDGIYHTDAYGLDENLAKNFLLPMVLRNYQEEDSVQLGYIMLDLSLKKKDAFYYGKILYSEASKRVLPLLIAGGVSLLCCVGTSVYMVMAWRRRYLEHRRDGEQTTRELRGFIGKFELQILFCVASFAGIPVTIGLYWHADRAGVLSNQEKALYFSGVFAFAIVFIFCLNRFIHTTILDSVRKRSLILNFWNKMNSIGHWFQDKYYLLGFRLRYICCVVSVCLWFAAIVLLCSLGWFYKRQDCMVGALVCLVAGIFLLLRYVLSRYRQNEFYREVLEGVKRISEGELTYQMTGEYSYREQEMADAINQIASGMQRAVEEQIKSERTKTRLITNVSHDIKTPLTSVINYVGLLKQEHLESERTREYLDVLDMKSQRLKILIEDLIEASKISSGAIELHPDTWNLQEFLVQVGGEFADRFAEKELELVSTIPEEPVMVWADSQRIFRVMENLYVNAYKYALPGTRIYLEVRREEQQAVVIIRNISEQRVEVNPEELTDRFVRGEESRSSDGSGLGLSIAKSLLELHGGSIKISTEADLFRVIVTLPLAQDEKESAQEEKES